MGTVKVSIIVPVFNMERLLKKCIDSLVCQSYTDIQIIIVDDGSKDSSGEVADKYAEKDSRILVVHHPVNKGIACGFMTGIRKADGDFIVFVDSDNTISDLMIDRLLKYQKQYSADIVQCEAVCYKTENEIYQYIEGNNLSGEIGVILEKQDIRNDFLRSKTITNNLAAKLFKRSLFSDIEIPEGRQIVDVIILPQILAKTSRYVCVTDKLYYAYQPDDSVSRGAISKWRIDDLIFDGEFYDRFINNNWKECRQYIPCRKLLTSLWAYNKILLANNIEGRERYLDYFYNIIKDNLKEARKGVYYRDITLKDKIRFMILMFSRTVYDTIIRKRHL